MSKITTEDCKLFLSKTFPELNEKGWKRIRKYKNDSSIWCRDFEHSSGKVVVLMEIDNVLKISDNTLLKPKQNKETEIKDISKVIYYKQFKPDQIKDAKKIVKKLTKFFEDDEKDIDISEMKGFDAIPSCFTFFFLGEGYKSDTKITEEINSNMDFSIFFSPITDKYYDQHLEHIIGNFLPDTYSEECECTFSSHFENDNEALTIKQILENLSEIGFIYDNKRCDLKNEFKDYTFIPKEIVEDKEKEILNETILEALKNDNSAIIEDLIKSKKMNVDYKVKSINILNYCYKNDKFNCFKTIIRNIDNLIEYNKGIKHIFENLLFSKYSYENNLFERYFDAIVESANINFENNDKYYIFVKLLLIKLERNNRENINIEDLKKGLNSIKKFFSEDKFKEVILSLVIALEEVLLDKEFLKIALEFIEDKKQDAITPNIQLQLEIGNNINYHIPEEIVDVLIKHKLKIGEKSIEEFIIFNYEKAKNIVNRKLNSFKIIKLDEYGNEIPESNVDRELFDFWSKQLLKIK